MKNLITFMLLLVVSLFATSAALAECKPLPTGKGKVSIQINGMKTPYYINVDGANASSDRLLLPGAITRRLNYVARERLEHKIKIGRSKVAKYAISPRKGKTWSLSINGCKYANMIVYGNQKGYDIDSNESVNASFISSFSSISSIATSTTPTRTDKKSATNHKKELPVFIPEVPDVVKKATGNLGGWLKRAGF